MDSTQPRLPLSTVQYLHRLLAGDAATEQVILDFIAARYGARSLFWLPAKVADEIMARPRDFVRAARKGRWEGTVSIE